jgi:hypothetical protein
MGVSIRCFDSIEEGHLTQEVPRDGSSENGRLPEQFKPAAG